MTIGQNTYEGDLVRRFIDGDDRAFSQIYRDMYFAVYQHAKRFLLDVQDAEDVTADTFVKLWNNRTKFSSRNEIAGFLHTTVRNACLDVLKHTSVVNKKQEELIHLYKTDELFGQKSSEILEEFCNAVYRLVDTMPKKTREIFLLSFEKGLKTSEIAEKLNISTQTVSNQKYTAINILKTAMENNLYFLILLSIISSK